MPHPPAASSHARPLQQRPPAGPFLHGCAAAAPVLRLQRHWVADEAEVGEPGERRQGVDVLGVGRGMAGGGARDAGQRRGKRAQAPEGALRGAAAAAAPAAVAAPGRHRGAGAALPAGPRRALPRQAHLELGDAVVGEDQRLQVTDGVWGGGRVGSRARGSAGCVRGEPTPPARRGHGPLARARAAAGAAAASHQGRPHSPSGRAQPPPHPAGCARPLRRGCC
jgi:hypothetical protein